MSIQAKNTPGFQASERTGIEIRFYPQGNDPVLVEQESFKPTGRLRYDSSPSIIAVNCQGALGAASGTFSITMKAGKRHHARSLFNDLNDDDWVDITFFRFAKRWHVVRGLIEHIQRDRQTGLGKATATTWTIQGKTFGTIWEKTPIWFSVFADENLSGAVSQRVFQSAENLIGSPDQAIDGYLRGFLSELGDVGRANWEMPRNMPGVAKRFIDSVYINVRGYPDEPALTGISSNWLMPQGTLWSLAQEWSDPIFNELIPDLYAKDEVRPDYNLSPGRELTVDQTKMYVIFRERPFPRPYEGTDSLWFHLPMWTIPRQMVSGSNVGRGGTERYNAYFVASQLVQEALPEAGIDLMEPLWDKQDMLRHGLRRFDVVSKYTSPNADLLGISTAQRNKVKDWYCLNPYFLSGTLTLGTGLPDIRKGCRIRILGRSGPSEDETYYVESVTHNWAFGSGVMTTLGVTRGWIGTDESLTSALLKTSNRYKRTTRATPKEFKP